MLTSDVENQRVSEKPEGSASAQSDGAARDTWSSCDAQTWTCAWTCIPTVHMCMDIPCPYACTCMPAMHMDMQMDMHTCDASGHVHGHACLRVEGRVHVCMHTPCMSMSMSMCMCTCFVHTLCMCMCMCFVHVHMLCTCTPAGRGPGQTPRRGRHAKLPRARAWAQPE